MVIAENIHKSYGTVKVLKGLDLRVEKSEIVAITGPSGVGKSTLLQILGSIDKPDKKYDFRLVINDISLQRLADKEMALFRNQHIGFIFQFHQLLPEFTAMENVCIPAYIGRRDTKQSKQKAKELLNFLGLENRIHHKPNQLSGGEQQRVAVARALVNNPSIILADEPSGNLDSNAAESLHKLFFKLREQFNQTFIIVTHDQELASMADRKLSMIDGTII